MYIYRWQATNTCSTTSSPQLFKCNENTLCVCLCTSVCNHVTRLKGARAAHINKVWTVCDKCVHTVDIIVVEIWAFLFLNLRFVSSFFFFGQLAASKSSDESTTFQFSSMNSFDSFKMYCECSSFWRSLSFFHRRNLFSQCLEWSPRENFSFISMMDLDLHVVKRNEQQKKLHNFKRANH